MPAAVFCCRSMMSSSEVAQEGENMPPSWCQKIAGSSNQRRTIYSAEGCCMRGHNQLILAQGNSEAPCHYSAAEEHAPWLLLLFLDIRLKAPWLLLLFPDIRLEIRDYCSLILLLYVDEMLITCSTPTLVSNFILLLNLRLICHFLGMEITPTTNGLHLSQSHYAVTILEPSNMVDCKPMGTPLRQK
ncbi:hypothetical protein SADUNF_Sadunf15G0040800 [Salix dunnii]|uniref:Reverse transcriptase Ty1/copia-type domain-containing protein n=1 Tax=Salix dunnii TaxID=1413687 RepID=A0A835JCG7_9ROSI|nr:hypothetical protein SADUNF_Sadunf15G0040800 [Salix dunnii]